jgi:hypothetical protein
MILGENFALENNVLVCTDYGRNRVLEIFKSDTSQWVISKYKGNIRGIGRNEDTVNIMRPTDYGNPYSMVRLQDAPRDEEYSSKEEREKCIVKHLLTTLGNPEFIDRVYNRLQGRPLQCCCAPRGCHGDILAFIANDFPGFMLQFEEFIEFLIYQSRHHNFSVVDSDLKYKIWNSYTSLSNKYPLLRISNTLRNR